jgi:hypothetical protein
MGLGLFSSTGVVVVRRASCYYRSALKHLVLPVTLLLNPRIVRRGNAESVPEPSSIVARCTAEVPAATYCDPINCFSFDIMNQGIEFGGIENNLELISVHEGQEQPPSSICRCCSLAPT